MRTVVELRTERLILRRWRADDLDGLAEVDGDPEVMRHIGDGSVRDRDQTAMAIENMERRWEEQGFGLFAAEVAGTGELAGWVGLAIPGFLPEVMPAVEIGWRLARRFWGAGIATEGARAVLADGFGRCGLDEIISIRQIDNTASGRVMEKLGFTPRPTTVVPWHGREVVVTRLDRATCQRSTAMSLLGHDRLTGRRQRRRTYVDQLLRVQNFNVSLDGFGAGENQTMERPFGHADPGTMFAWAGATASWPMRTDPGGSRGLDDYLTRDYERNIGAEIMGRNKFGPQRGPWTDHDWQGWWGAEPPFRTPVFVMTHHARPSFTLGATTFHFVDADPATVLEQARAAAQGKDVRLGGGATTIREFLDADLVDTLHVAVSQVQLGSGARLWESPDELLDRFHLDVVPSPSGSVTHHLFWRR